MWFAAILSAFLIFLLVKLVINVNRDFCILALCPRIKTVDLSKLETKVHVMPGVTIFGNNFDFWKNDAASVFAMARQYAEKAKYRSYILYCVTAPMLNIITVDEVEEILQSQELLTKNLVYNLVEPFLGNGLLISTDKKWHSRRKLMTPAFHFNILQTFLEIFKEECKKTVLKFKSQDSMNIALNEVISQYTLNSICETALGVKLDNVDGGDKYRYIIHELEEVMVERFCNVVYFTKTGFYLSGRYKKHKKDLAIAHAFSRNIIEHRRKFFQQSPKQKDVDIYDEYGKKKRYAMLDTLLDAESKGLIDQQGICDEVNTFMFEGFDTTFTCIIFCLLNLAWYPQYQQKCYAELENLGDIQSCSIFDFNQLEYLECFIKETLRLYPSVPFIGRRTVKKTTLNGLVLPSNTQINLHTFDILRDPKHFENPQLFNPDRFLPTNTTSRHPFAFVPFSAGPRNCIGQKFAMLEIKVLLASILKIYLIEPKTLLNDIIFENGIILRTKENPEIKLIRRK